MRLGLDARALASPVRSGVEHYVINLTRALAALPESPDIVAYVDTQIADPALAALSSERLKISLVRARHGWLRAALPWRLWRDRADLVHLPSTILPPILPCPAVVTVHDLAWARFPETYDPADLRMQTEVVPRSLRRAAHIITVSQSTARDLVETLDVPADKITAIPLGVSPSFSPDGPALSPDAFPGAERLAGGYLLHLATGGPHPRKNVGLLLAAYARLRADQPAPPLVVAGDVASERGRALLDKAADLGLAEDVIFPGQVSETVLPALYRSATILAYASSYEGFGLPILEAMASGLPVITSNRSSMPEVAGDAAILIDPENAEDLTAALARALRDDALRRDLAQRGLARSREFTWERTARDTVAVYQRIGGRS